MNSQKKSLFGKANKSGRAGFGPEIAGPRDVEPGIAEPGDAEPGTGFLGFPQ